MDLVKIGRFISKKRKDKKMTQSQLAEKLNISDRAISKWENGHGLPDPAIMMSLCAELGIDMNELFNGQNLGKQEDKQQAIATFIKLKKLEEQENKKKVVYEFAFGLMGTFVLLISLFFSIYAIQNIIWKLVLILFGCFIFGIGITFALYLGRDAGYYECKSCHYQYVPPLYPFLFCFHIGSTRYLKCPKCHGQTWNKKRLTKTEKQYFPD